MVAIIRKMLPVIIFMHIIYFVPIIGAANVLSKCDQCRAAHPGWSQKICLNVAQGKIEKGMTEAQVIASWGSPKEKFTLVTGYSYWHYPIKITPANVIYRDHNGELYHIEKEETVLQIRNGKVIDIKPQTIKHYE